MSRLSLLTVAVLAIALLDYGCGQSVVGTSCDASDPCPTGFDCIFDRDGNQVCAYVCEYPVDTVCVDGSACGPIGTMGGACWPGGTVAFGGDCTGTFDCARGGICVAPAGAATGQCFRGCNYGDTNTCPGSARCSPTIEGGGYCP